MEARTNYSEPCVCGDNLESIMIERVWRIVTWKCPTCGKTLASTIVSDSPVTAYYVKKKLMKETNRKLRKEKGLPEKKTIVTFYDDSGKRIAWKEIEEKNRRWEKQMGHIQRKAF